MRAEGAAGLSEEAAGKETLVARARSRLWRGRWILGAASLALLATSAMTGGPVFAALAGMLFVTAVTVFLPAGGESGRTAEGPALRTAGFSTADLIGAVRDPVIVVDQQTSVVETNAAARSAFLSLEPGTLLSLRFRSPEMQRLLQHLSEAGFEGGEAEYLERVPIERLYRVFASPAGSSGLRVLVFRDRSETRRIERMRADFVANASHEMRTPLASIAGFIETLRGSARNDPAARDSFLQIMQNQTDRMARLIDDLLSLSRLEMKPLIDPDSRVDLVAVVNDVIGALAPLALDCEVAVTREFALDQAPVAGSRDELFQVFENLLQNACKYGRSGASAVVSIAEAGSAPSREFQVTVTDFGPGIAEEHIPRLTERFYRVDANGSQKGTGLGLSIVKHILTRHNGYLSIVSELGKGSAFTVHLPAA